LHNSDVAKRTPVDDGQVTARRRSPRSGKTTRPRPPQARVGRPAPSFDLPCTKSQQNNDGRARLPAFAGQWLLLIFYPRDFSFVCPGELNAFSGALDDFRERDCTVLGISVDAVEVHERWLRTPEEQGGVFGLRFALCADEDRRVASMYGVDFNEHGVAGRGLFLIDPQGVLQYQVVHNLSVGRSPAETLRVLDALREGGLCPVSWTRADGVIDPTLGLGPGRVWGHFRIEELLGEGGFGRVWSAVDLLLERRVAIKVGQTGRGSARREMLGEARLQAKVKHPNVCAIYSVEEADGVPLIVMEYLPGGSLRERLEKARLPQSDARRLAREITAGVAASHRMGVVHGDLKPANILFAQDGTAKVVDFGVGRSIALPGEEERAPQKDTETTIPIELGPTTSAKTPKATVTAKTLGTPAVFGTPAYMAPEQTRGARADAKSDVFVVGLVLFELWTGERAVQARSQLEALRAVRALDLPTLAQKLPERVRSDWQRICAHEPQDRPTMAETHALVQRW
jgi:alkyl hydroperoxide reductase subunit AhpC